MSSVPNPSHEPTMEEILASIRKIISEDQPEPANAVPASAPAPAIPTPVRAAAMEPAPKAEAEVLELTEEIPDEEPEPFVPPRSLPPIDNDIAFETIEAEPKAESAMDDLISDVTRTAMGRAFSNLDRGSEVPEGLDGLFLKAVRDAFTPTLQEWVDSHRAELFERMKPLIREWMDENLPGLIEAAVAKEIAQAAAGNRSRRK